MVFPPARRDVQCSTQVSVTSRNLQEPFSARFYVAQTIAMWHDSAVKYRQNRVKMVRGEVRNGFVLLFSTTWLNLMTVPAVEVTEKQVLILCLARVSATMLLGWKFEWEMCEKWTKRWCFPYYSMRTDEKKWSRNVGEMVTCVEKCACSIRLQEYWRCYCCRL